jgi:hypothetical protein
VVEVEVAVEVAVVECAAEGAVVEGAVEAAVGAEVVRLPTAQKAAAVREGHLRR